MDDFDVIIVGAGPAGSSAAYKLAEQGQQVLLLERGKSPGSKNVYGGRIYPYSLSKLIPDYTLLIVDAVTSFGTVDVDVDKWNIDAIYSCSQKGLSCPPGASPVSFSSKAIDKLKNRKSKVPNWYLDLSMIINYW